VKKGAPARRRRRRLRRRQRVRVLSRLKPLWARARSHELSPREWRIVLLVRAALRAVHETEPARKRSQSSNGLRRSGAGRIPIRPRCNSAAYSPSSSSSSTLFLFLLAAAFGVTALDSRLSRPKGFFPQRSGSLAAPRIETSSPAPSPAPAASRNPAATSHTRCAATKCQGSATDALPARPAAT